MILKSKHYFTALTVALCWLPVSLSAQLKVMTIGDSLTEEYYFEFIFSAPSATPLLGFANTKNWVEILAEERPSEMDFGNYENQWPFGYQDFRQAGYAYNFGIPGYDTQLWLEIIDPFSSTDLLTLPLRISTRTVMRNLYTDMDVVVVMVGGNDVNFQYGDLYSSIPGDSFATSFINQVIENLGSLIDEIRDHNSTVPIVLADIPDLGATPDIIADHPDPAMRANATAIVNELNIAVAQFAANRNLTLAPVSSLTDRLLSSEPFFIGTHEMINNVDSLENNRPEYLFCWQGLHPSTNGQALIANVMIEAINSATSSNISPLGNREILSDLLGFNPDQPYLDWAANNNLTDTSMLADTDLDGLLNIGEYLLGFDPQVADSNLTASIQNSDNIDFLTLGYSTNEEGRRLADVVPRYSTNLTDWMELPEEWLINLSSDDQQIRVPVNNTDHQGRVFVRLEFELRP